MEQRFGVQVERKEAHTGPLSNAGVCSWKAVNPQAVLRDCLPALCLGLRVMVKACREAEEKNYVNTNQHPNLQCLFSHMGIILWRGWENINTYMS